MGGASSCQEKLKNRENARTTTSNLKESYSGIVEKLDEKISKLHSEVNEIQNTEDSVNKKLIDEMDEDQQPTAQQSQSAVESDQRIFRLKSDLEELKAMMANPNIRHLIANELSDSHSVTTHNIVIATTEVEPEDKISILEAQVKELRQILVDNMEKVMERGEKLKKLINFAGREESVHTHWSCCNCA